jgi:hypothetical protein
MRLTILVMITLLLLGCGYRKPATHEPVMHSYQNLSLEQAVTRLAAAMKAEGIPIKSEDPEKGRIVSDSFDVNEEWCDCGKNLLGEEYLGTRRGVMKVSVRRSRETTVTFDFKTRLTILANDKQLICGSLGVLEKKILSHVKTDDGSATGESR